MPKFKRSGVYRTRRHHEDLKNAIPKDKFVDTELWCNKYVWESLLGGDCNFLFRAPNEWRVTYQKRVQNGRHESIIYHHEATILPAMLHRTTQYCKTSSTLLFPAANAHVQTTCQIELAWILDLLGETKLLSFCATPPWPWTLFHKHIFNWKELASWWHK